MGGASWAVDEATAKRKEQGSWNGAVREATKAPACPPWRVATEAPPRLSEGGGVSGRRWRGHLFGPGRTRRAPAGCLRASLPHLGRTPPSAASRPARLTSAAAAAPVFPRP